MILTERNVNEETSFLDDSPGLFHHWDCLHPSYDWDLICLCSSFSRLSPNGVAFLGAAMAWIGVGCVICLIVTIFSTKFLWENHSFLYLLGLALMVLPLVFYNPNLVASTGAKTGWLMEISPYFSLQNL